MFHHYVLTERRSYRPRYIIKIEIPNFDGKDDPKVFSNWLDSIQEFFDWNNMVDDRKLGSAKMKLVGLAKRWRYGVEADKRLGSPPIRTLQELKRKLLSIFLQVNAKCHENHLLNLGIAVRFL